MKIFENSISDNRSHKTLKNKCFSSDKFRGFLLQNLRITSIALIIYSWNELILFANFKNGLILSDVKALKIPLIYWEPNEVTIIEMIQNTHLYLIFEWLEDCTKQLM